MLAIGDWLDGELPDRCAMIGHVVPDIATARPVRMQAELALLVAAIVRGRGEVTTRMPGHGPVASARRLPGRAAPRDRW